MVNGRATLWRHAASVLIGSFCACCIQFSRAVERVTPPLAPDQVAGVQQFDFSPDGQQLFFIADSSGTSLFDVYLDRGTLAPQRVLADSGARGEHYRLGTNHVYYTTINDDLFRAPLHSPAEISLIANTVLRTEAISPNEQFVVIRASNFEPGYHLLTLGETPNRVLLGSIIPIGYCRSQFVFGPDEQTLYYLVREDGQEVLYRRSLGVDNQPNRLSPRFGDSCRFSVSAETGRIVFTGGHSSFRRMDVYSVPIDGSAPATQLSPPGTNPVEMRYDDPIVLGSHTFFMGEYRREGVVEAFGADVNGIQPAQVLNPPLDSESNVDRLVSAGDKILFSISNIDGSSMLFVVDGQLGGAAQEIAVPGFGADSKLALSPDNTRAVVTTASGIWNFALDTGLLPVEQPIPLTASQTIRSIAVSPDGSATAVNVVDADSGLSDIYLVPTSESASPQLLVSRIPRDSLDDEMSFDPAGTVLVVPIRPDRFGSELIIPLDPTGEPRPMGGTRPESGDVDRFSVRPLGDRKVLYVADQEHYDSPELYLATSQDDVRKLSAQESPFVEHVAFVDEGAGKVVYLTSLERHGPEQALYLVELDDGGSTYKIDQRPISGAPDFFAKNNRVVYLGLDDSGARQVYSAILDENPQPVVVPRPNPESEIDGRYKVSNDLDRVSFFELPTFKLFAAPIDGTELAADIGQDVFVTYNQFLGRSDQFSFDGSKIYFLSGSEIWWAPSDGSASPTAVNGTFSPATGLHGSSTDGILVFSLDSRTYGLNTVTSPSDPYLISTEHRFTRWRLTSNQMIVSAPFIAPLSGGGPTVNLSAGFDQVDGETLLADDQHMVFTAELEDEGRVGIFAVDVDDPENVFEIGLNENLSSDKRPAITFYSTLTDGWVLGSVRFLADDIQYPEFLLRMNIHEPSLADKIVSKATGHWVTNVVASPDSQDFYFTAFDPANGVEHLFRAPARGDNVFVDGFE